MMHNNDPFCLKWSFMQQCVTLTRLSKWTQVLQAFGFLLLPFSSPWQQPFHQVSKESFELALLVIIVYLSCQSSTSAPRSSICMGHHYMWLLIGCRARQCPCQPLFSAVTGDCSRLAHCWASFSQCKCTHVGQGDKYGHVGLELKQEKRVPHGLNCGLFWHTDMTLLHQMLI